MISAEEQAFYRSADVRDQLSSAYRRGGRMSGRFALVSAQSAQDYSWQVAVFRDSGQPDRWIAWMSVLTWTAGRARRRWWVLPAESESAAELAAAEWTSFYDRHRSSRDRSRPDSPADARYWLLHPDWVALDVPEWAARRLAMLSAAYPDSLDGPGWDRATTGEAIAWAVITVGLQDTPYPALRHPDEVRRAYGLTSALTPVTAIAALWRLEQLGHPGMTIEIDGSSSAHLDPCELATLARLTALDRWISAGNHPHVFTLIDAENDTPLDYEVDIIWMAHGKTGDDITPWREVLAELQLPQSCSVIADLALMWEAGVGPAETLAWGKAIGKRRLTSPFAWTEIAVRLVPAGVRAVDADYHARRRANGNLYTLSSHLKHLVDTGWITDAMADIPWPVREQGRKAGRNPDELRRSHDVDLGCAPPRAGTA
ncbi:hypothetical protein ACQPZJ_44590 [Actinoplanes sp. CA-054009]